MAQWTVLDKTDRALREHLASSNDHEEDYAVFVDRAVRAEILRRTVKEMQEHNANIDPDEIEAIVDEAVDWARANPT